GGGAPALRPRDTSAGRACPARRSHPASPAGAWSGRARTRSPEGVGPRPWLLEARPDERERSACWRRRERMRRSARNRRKLRDRAPRSRRGAVRLPRRLYLRDAHERRPETLALDPAAVQAFDRAAADVARDRDVRERVVHL